MQGVGRDVHSTGKRRRTRSVPRPGEAADKQHRKRRDDREQPAPDRMVRPGKRDQAARE